MSAAKIGETWKDPSGVSYVVVGADPANKKVNTVGTGWIPDDLAAAGWAEAADSPTELEIRVEVLEEKP